MDTKENLLEYMKKKSFIVGFCVGLCLTILFIFYWTQRNENTLNININLATNNDTVYKSLVESLAFIRSSNLQKIKVRVCIPAQDRNLCNNLERDGSQAQCLSVESRVDCAIKLSRGEADLGVFSEEETLLLAQQSPNEGRVLATIRDVRREEPYAFETVAIVSANHTGGIEGLRNGKYCHPGFDISDLRWSPRVLKTFEYTVASSDRCPNLNTRDKSADELEVETLNGFFSAACRPGPWSANATVDENLKRRYPNLCSLCGTNCTGYSTGISVADALINNRHIQALECMRSAGDGGVAYVAWQHVREYFQQLRPTEITSFAVFCDNGSTMTLTAELLLNNLAPCSFVKQPWSTIVASTNSASTLAGLIPTWWSGGANPGGNTWQSILFSGIIGGSEARIFFETEPLTPANYVAPIRTITSIDSTTNCLPARRWCTRSPGELTKCSWLRSAAHVLGIQPAITCMPRANAFDCLRDIKDNQLDLFVSSSNYGYLARQHYNLSPVKLVQNPRSTSTRVAAYVKESLAQNNITRFENLRGTKACFPEFGGIAYMAFVKSAHDRGIISRTECDYARAVGEFFDGACAPGAIDASHALTDKSDFNSTTLCSVCRPAGSVTGSNTFTCAWNYSNMFFGKNGTMACLNDPTTHVAVLQTSNIEANLLSLNISGTSFRALCRNNTLALNTGVTVDDGCLLAHVTDAEVITRRNDPLWNALNVQLDHLEKHFGYLAESGAQHINFEMFSPLDDVSDLLFKDTAIGLSEPSAAAANELARNYIELFNHLESCTGAASPSPGQGLASRNIYSILTLGAMAVLTRFVIY